eukprot:466900-Prorocentrum_minimum.AAC.6
MFVAPSIFVAAAALASAISASSGNPQLIQICDTHLSCPSTASSAVCSVRWSGMPFWKDGKKSNASPLTGATARSTISNLVAPPSGTVFRYNSSVARRWYPFCLAISIGKASSCARKC